MRALLARPEQLHRVGNPGNQEAQAARVHCFHQWRPVRMARQFDGELYAYIHTLFLQGIHPCMRFLQIRTRQLQHQRAQPFV